MTLQQSPSKLLPQGQIELIASYTDQLYDGRPSERVSAAVALGNFASFLKPTLRPETLRIAEERAIWENLMYHLKTVSS
jgi:hypothetical protein